MKGEPLMITSFPNAIIHIDGDAFFASCEQARNPKLKGRPVITGKERGIAASMSYEAKAKGITRGMRVSDMLKLCPDAVIMPSDYETYSLLSKRFFDIVRRYTPMVEEYSIDECFADFTGLRRRFRTSYIEIAERLRKDLEHELGFTFSMGLAPTKVLAKVGSKWKKPDGFTAIQGRLIHKYLQYWPVEKVWGIGPQTTAYLAKMNIHTALQYAEQEEAWVKSHLTKPFFEIWQELRGHSVYPVTTAEKTTYYSIQKVKTFSPASSERVFVFAQLSKNIENACMKARKYKLASPKVIVFLRTHDFQDSSMEIKLSRPTNFPNDIVQAVEPHFDEIFSRRFKYRSTGAMLLDLTEDNIVQQDLFGESIRVEKLQQIYASVDAIRAKYGKHTLFLGSSFQAHKFAQHIGDRGDAPERRGELWKGETKRKRLKIPMFVGYIV
jgi:DNA polymerase-4/DNA polymerase V